ncbi:MAG TPA: ATP-binding cassette domain-containing protein [Anaerolineae bacterium]|nr:ATP-binding cassette domain-containing protein [Anaerolineae bacterium]
MSILTASDLAKSYGPQDVFGGVSFEIPHGAKIALIGPNGSGKTTLLRLVMGLEEPSGGAIHRAKGLRLGYLPQQANAAPMYSSAVHPSGTGTLWQVMSEVFADLQAQAAELRRLEASMAHAATREEALQRYGPELEAFELAGGYTYEQRIEQVLYGLDFVEQDFRRPIAQLSGGQKTRAMLARLLLEEPDLLLLDEPTGHLDLAGIEWLEDYLKAWKGAVVLVAHDRAFLDAVVEQVWELERGRLAWYRGNYSAYIAQRAERLALQQASYERQQQVIARTEEFIRRNIAGQRTREAKGRRKRLARLERIQRPPEDRPMGFTLGDVARSGDLVLGLYDLTVGYDPAAPLFAARELELRRGQRVALVGPNGSGKTTLVRTILDHMPPLGGRVRIGASVYLGYLAQGHVNLIPEKTVLETILDAGELTPREARTMLGRYHFPGDDVFKRVGDLSGGEQARVALAILALQGANVLILDEPTNHLDISSQEVLQEVLAGFDGTLLIVTHDRYLIRRLATLVWAIADGQLWEFKEGAGIGSPPVIPSAARNLGPHPRGPYDEYHVWEVERRQQKQGAREARLKTERERTREAGRAAEREAVRQTHRQAELEQTIHELEVRRAQLEAQLAVASERQQVERVRQLGAEYRQIEEELDTLLASWTDVVV